MTLKTGRGLNADGSVASLCSRGEIKLLDHMLVWSGQGIKTILSSWNEVFVGKDTRKKPVERVQVFHMLHNRNKDIIALTLPQVWDEGSVIKQKFSSPNKTSASQ